MTWQYQLPSLLLLLLAWRSCGHIPSTTTASTTLLLLLLLPLLQQCWQYPSHVSR
jgi:hypothetical protein